MNTSVCVHLCAPELHGSEGECLVCYVLQDFSRCKGWEVADVTTLFVHLAVTVLSSDPPYSGPSVNRPSLPQLWNRHLIHKMVVFQSAQSSF